MDEVHYLISDASRKVDVEAHVLRYWEEELELAIPRNEMFYPQIGVGKRLDGGRRRVKKYLWSF